MSKLPIVEDSLPLKGKYTSIRSKLSRYAVSRSSPGLISRLALLLLGAILAVAITLWTGTIAENLPVEGKSLAWIVSALAISWSLVVVIVGRRVWNMVWYSC